MKSLRKTAVLVQASITKSTDFTAGDTESS